MTYRITDRALERGVAVIELAGEADLVAAPELRARINRAIDAGAQRLVLDLSDAIFLDSTALGILVAALKRLRPRGGRIAVVCADPAITKVFEITGLDRLFPIAADLPEALAELG